MEEYDEVIITGAAVDVPTDNYEEFDNELIPEKLGDKLIQKNSLKGTKRELQFYATNNLVLHLLEKKKAPVKQYRINLSWLSAEPSHNKIIIWKWLYYAIASLLATGLLFYLASSQLINADYGFIAVTIAFTCTLIFTLIFIYCIRDEYIFKSCFGNAEIFLLENKKPDLKTFDEFFLNIQKTIDRAHSKNSISDRLVGELKMCRRLRDEGIIDDDAYTRARTTIFSHKEYKS